MHYADQATPPFNSPYQRHNSRVDSLLDLPYLSPNRNDSVSKHAQGLGLYSCQQPFPLPPSPQSSEHWNDYVSTSAPSLVVEAIADPYTSGAFDHPVSRSPHPWASAQMSPRSPAYSHTGSDRACPTVKMESTEWSTSARFAPYCSSMDVLSSSQQPLTSFAYTSAYDPSPMTRLIAAPTLDYDNRNYERESSKETTASISSTGKQERSRNRKYTDPDSAPFRCSLCPNKGFARRYNFNQHMLTHELHRKKENKCHYPDCNRQFVRKTDLGRHERSVHIKDKCHKCKKCEAAFTRSDTLQRFVPTVRVDQSSTNLWLDTNMTGAPTAAKYPSQTQGYFRNTGTTRTGHVLRTKHGVHYKRGCEALRERGRLHLMVYYTQCGIFWHFHACIGFEYLGWLFAGCLLCRPLPTGSDFGRSCDLAVN
jgi:hypothetical protein